MLAAILWTGWTGPAIAVAFGTALWSCGARFSRHTVMVLGFAAGVPAGAWIAEWGQWSMVPPVVGAVLGAFLGLLVARLAYRLMLGVTICLASALLGLVVSSAIVDSGAVSPSQGAEIAAAARDRAARLAEAVADELQAEVPDQPALDGVRASVQRFWNALQPPERTLVTATTAACALVGLILGFFLRSIAEIAATAMIGAVLVAWGAHAAIGQAGPPLGTWCMATLVLAAVGMAVQAATRPRAPAAAPAAAPAT